MQHARLNIMNLLRKSRPPPPNLNWDESRALKELRSRNGGLVILPVDKGQAMVVVDLCDYDKKLQSLLDNVVVYQRLEKAPAPALEVNSKLLSFWKQG